VTAESQLWNDFVAPATGVLEDSYLRAILRREAVDAGPDAPVRRAEARLFPLIFRWAGASLVKVHPSGSFAKGTANHSGTDIDLFVSLREDADATLRAIYDGLDRALRAAGYAVRRQNVSLNVKAGGFSVDLVPGKRHKGYTTDHSLYVRRQDTWIKTNVLKHVDWVHSTRRQDEMRLMKLWRDQNHLDWPSFYVELATARALEGLLLPDSLSANLRRALLFARDELERARLADPGNPSNIVSDTLTADEKRVIARAATAALKDTDIRRVVR
jgi:hypothetical protein